MYLNVSNYNFHTNVKKKLKYDIKNTVAFWGYLPVMSLQYYLTSWIVDLSKSWIHVYVLLFS